MSRATRTLGMLLFALASPLGCGHDAAESSAAAAVAPEERASASASEPAEAAKTERTKGARGKGERDPKAKGEHAAKGKDGARGARGKGAAPKMPVPAIHSEALGRSRAFLHDMVGDNHAYQEAQGADFFKAFAASQTPRATIVTCADSRVQAGALRARPENDLFTIRNIGNQFAIEEGSIEYGVHHLHTPVLAIVGHTGCGAVKAAMGDFSEESEAIARELSPLKVPKTSAADPDEAWAEAVVFNVHSQVTAALRAFPEAVTEGSLTVVGLVYDFRNDLKKGYGALVLVDVNGHSDPKVLDELDAAARAALAGDAHADAGREPSAASASARAGKAVASAKAALAANAATSEPPAHTAAADAAATAEPNEPGAAH